METKHTPGPWTFNPDLADSGYKDTDVFGGGNNLYEPVCIIPHDDMTEAGYEEVKANARLIAAAPELLESLLLCRVHMYEHASNTEDGAFDKLCEAIAKATGASHE